MIVKSDRERNYIDPYMVYNDDDEDTTVGLPDDDHERPAPSTIPNKDGE